MDSHWRYHLQDMASIRGLPPKHLLALLLFLASLALYLLTLASSITQRNLGVDGPELATAAHTLGVAHPPGYPTYLVLAKLLSLLLPWGDVAHRISVLSALSGAGVTVMVYYTSHLLIESAARNASPPSLQTSIAASIAAASFAFSPLLWSQAIITEVYTLNALFTGGIMLLFLQWYRDPTGSSRPLLVAGLTLGLGLGNHLTLAFLALPLAYCLAMHRTRLTPRLMAGFLGLLLLGLGVYLYLPLRASSNPPINWGDASTLEGFIWTVSAKPYRELALGLPLADLPERLVEWGDLLLRQVNALGLLLVGLGVWRLRAGNAPLLVFTGLLFLSSFAYSIMYFTADAQVYLLPGFMALFSWTGVGLHWLMGIAAKLGEQRKRPAMPQIALAVATFLGIPVLTLLLNFQGTSLRNDRESLAYAQGVFQRVEPEAVIIADTERELFPLWYYSYVIEDGRGPAILSTRLLQFDWYIRGQRERYADIVPPDVTGAYWDRLTRIVEHSLGKRPVYITAGASSLLSQFEGQEEDGLYLLTKRRTW